MKDRIRSGRARLPLAVFMKVPSTDLLAYQRITADNDVFHFATVNTRIEFERLDRWWLASRRNFGVGMVLVATSTVALEGEGREAET